MTLLELMVALTLLMIGLLGYLQVVVMTTNAGRTAREHALAAEAVRAVVESIKARTFADVFALYNADPNDDPGGAGTAPGRDFPIAGLRAAADDQDGIVGEVNFPTTNANFDVLREDVVDTRFGTPRDLDSDGVIDNADHSTDYQLLPVAVRARWQSKAGATVYQVTTLLVELP